MIDAPPPSSSPDPAPTAAPESDSTARRPAGETPARAAPASLTDLFLAFTHMALQGFGGVLAVVQRELVERRRWMTREEFVEEWAVAQVMPGPNVINLAIIYGAQQFGWRGAVVGVAGILAAPLCVVVTLALLYARFSDIPQVQATLRGMGGVTAGLIAATGLKLLPALAKHPLGWRLASVFTALTFVAVAWLRVPLAGVLFSLGLLSCVLTWRRLAPAPARAEGRE